MVFVTSPKLSRQFRGSEHLTYLLHNLCLYEAVKALQITIRYDSVEKYAALHREMHVVPEIDKQKVYGPRQREAYKAVAV